MTPKPDLSEDNGYSRAMATSSVSDSDEEDAGDAGSKGEFMCDRRSIRRMGRMAMGYGY